MSTQIDSRAASTAIYLFTAAVLSSAASLCQAGVPFDSPASSLQPTTDSGMLQLSATPLSRFRPLPAYFDLRDEGRAAPARPDDSCASCWSDAATYVMESLLMPGEEVDLSDAHMQLVQNQTCQAGASVESAMNYLVSWNGPIAESDYNQLVLKQGMKARERAHVQQVRYLPLRQGPLDNFRIKDAIYHYGPAYASVGWRGITNPTYNSYYWPGNSAVHAVALVGWDDDFPKEQFTSSYQGNTYTPAGDGAFIAKNNNGGFYFLSYYDGTVGYNTVATFNLEPVSNYQHIYQHDPHGTRSWIGPHKIPDNNGVFVPAIFGANLFTAQEAETLSTVGFYVQPYMLVPGAEAVFHVAIHLDPDSGPVSSAGPALSFTTRVALGGYHSITLPSEIPLSANQRFSVVLWGYSSTGTHNAIHLPVERRPFTEPEPSPVEQGPFEVSPGESFISKDGLSWFDVTEVPDTNSETGAMEYVYGNLGIKAYTKATETATKMTDYRLVQVETTKPMQLKPRRPVYTLGAAPLLDSTTPLSNDTVATEHPQITAYFDREVKPGPGLAQITLSAHDESRTAYASVDGDALSIFPVGPLGDNDLGGKQWTVTIPAGAVTDLYGKPTEQPYAWSFWVIGVN